MFFQCLAALLLAFLFTRMLWMRWRYDLHKIPSPPGWPLLGHAFLFVGSKGEKELTYARAYWWKRLGWPNIMKVPQNSAQLNALCIRVPQVNLPGLSVLYVKDMKFAKSVLFSKTDVLLKHTLDGIYNVRFFL